MMDLIKQAWITPILLIVILWMGLPSGNAAPPPGDHNTLAPAARTDDTIIPDRWLNGWDPVTIFFKKSMGPSKPGPENTPEKFVQMTPIHPGGWRWLNPRTLQFTPSQPWPAFSEFSIRTDRVESNLNTVLPAPIRTNPENGDDDVMPVETIQLTFPVSTDPDPLAERIRIELREPGTAETVPRQVLDKGRFSLKRLGPEHATGETTYALTLDTPIPHSTAVRLLVDLTTDSGVPPQFELRFTTARDFSVLAAGAGTNWLPLSPRGTHGRETETLSLSINPPVLSIRMSSIPVPAHDAALWDFIHVAPNVPDLSYTIKDRIIEVSGGFEPETAYRVTLRPTVLLKDHRNRPLHLDHFIEVPFVFRKPDPILQWERAAAVVERYGPKMLPIRGRGKHTAELRLYKIDPLDRRLWPFPVETVSTDPIAPPPEPFDTQTYHDQARYGSSWDLEKSLKTLGSPNTSDLLSLPLDSMGDAGRYGLDLAPYLETVDGRNAPGTYLAALQPVDNPGERQWIRFQVTDLSLTTVEEPDTVTFLVSSLQSARPLANARVTVEGFSRGEWIRLISGVTDPMGVFFWKQNNSRVRSQPRRVRIERGRDQLVLDTFHPPRLYRNGYWSEAGDWLYQVVNYPESRYREKQTGHVFTERPVYKPGTPVHIRGWVRIRDHGNFRVPEGVAVVTVRHAGGREWTSVVDLSRRGGFYHRFHPEDTPAGSYDVQVVMHDRVMCRTAFRMEDYRIPRFEVRLHGSETVPLDRPFDVSLTAAYYAGGNMVERPVDWQVTQHPGDWEVTGYPGFHFADDDRFTGRPGLRDDSVLKMAALTDETGAAQITIDPLNEPSLTPRIYIVEGTVTDVDEQTVTGVKRIKATPAFILGLKAPRLVAPGRPLQAETLVLNPDGKPEAGREITVRWIRRTWHAVLKAGNYGAGDVQYDTHTVETPLKTITVSSSTEPVPIVFPVTEAGVYVVEVSARDRLGRAQVVQADIFVKGDTPVTWDRPSDSGFSVRFDRDIYAPGDTAKLLLESPFQTAEAAAVVESPGSTRILYASVRNGTGTIEIPVQGAWSPGVPVSVLLMRGRLPGSAMDPVSGIDLGKPRTLGAMTQLPVSKTPYRINIDVEHPEKAMPGDTVHLKILMTDPDGQSLGGEAAVWLVDRAILALGRETPSDPLEDLLHPWPSRAGLRDTREYIVGRLPGVDTPGGGFGAMAGELSMFDRLSLRKRFEAVPFYEPFVEIGPDGQADLEIDLPDNLTQYAVRVKAVAGANRFGFARSRLAVRLPLVIQPTLPRFIRFGDMFDAIAVSRIVEGDGGTGRVAVQADALEVTDEASREVQWKQNVPVRTDFRLSVPAAEYDASGQPVFPDIRVRLAAERLSDGVGDASETAIPVREESRQWRDEYQDNIAAGDTMRIPAIDPDRIRAGSGCRRIWISNQPIMVTALRADAMLRSYPFGCTEQRTSIASGFLSLISMQAFLSRNTAESTYRETIQSTIDYYASVMTPDGLTAFWPGGKGHVHLTARVVRFLAEARMAGFDVDPLVVDRMVRALKQALRSDSPMLQSSIRTHERVMALEALYSMGIREETYLEEMGRSVETLGTTDRARMVRLLADLDGVDPERIQRLVDGLVADVIIDSINGRQMASGLRGDPRFYINRDIFMTDITAISEILLTLNHVNPTHASMPALTDGLCDMLESRSLTTYHADSLLRVLNALIQSGAVEMEPAVFRVNGTEYSADTDTPVHVFSDNGAEALTVAAESGALLWVRAELTGIVRGSAAEYPPETDGFAITRSWRRMDSNGRIVGTVTFDAPGRKASLSQGDIIEEHIQLVNPEHRSYVVIRIPMAAGMEPLNPALSTAPPEARPEGVTTRAPDYRELRDDCVAYYYNDLPRGTYHIYFRTRASFTGRFIQPAASAILMYDAAITGGTSGAYVEITPAL